MRKTFFKNRFATILQKLKLFLPRSILSISFIRLLPFIRSPFVLFIRRWLVRLFACLILLTLLLTGVLWTQTGSRFVVEKIAAHYQIQLNDIRGNLIEGFDIGELNYVPQLSSNQTQASSAQLKKINAKQISFRWQPMGLLYTAIKLQRLSVDTVSVDWTSTSSTQKNIEWPNFSQAFLIEINHIQINKILLHHDETEEEFSKLQANASMGAFNLTIVKAQVERGEESLLLDGKIATRFPYAASFKGKYAVTMANDDQAFATDYKLDGDITRFKLETTSSLWDRQKNTLKPEASDELKLVAQVKTGIENRSSNIADLLKARAKKMTGANKNATADNAEPPLQIQLKLSARIRNLEERFHNQSVKELSDLTFSTEASVNIQRPFREIKELNLDLSHSQVNLKVYGKSFSTNFEGRMPVKWDSNGLLDLGLDIRSGNVSLDTAKSTQILKTVGSKASQSIASRKSEPSIEMRTQGDVNLQLNLPFNKKAFSVQDFNSDLALEFRKLSLVTFNKNLASDLNGALRLKTRFKTDLGFVGELKDIAVKGTFLSQPVSVAGFVGWEKAAISQTDLAAHLGENDLGIKSNADKNQLQWDIKIPNLQNFQTLLESFELSTSEQSTKTSPIRGEFVSHGNFSGDFKKPHLEIAVSAKNIQWQDFSIESLTANLVPQTGTNHQMILDAKSLSWQDNKIRSFQIKSDGNFAQHNLSFVIQRDATRDQLNTEIQGRVAAGFEQTKNQHWQDLTWRGVWKSLSVKVKDLPEWTLDRADAFSANKKSFKLDNLCLAMQETQATQEAKKFLYDNRFSSIKQKSLQTAEGLAMSPMTAPDKTSICINAQQNILAAQQATPSSKNLASQQNSWSAEIDLIGLPAQYFSTWLKADTHLIGYADGHIELWQRLKGTIDGKAKFNSRGLALVYQFQDQAAEVYRVKDAELTGALSNREIQMQTRLDLGNYGYLNANGTYQIVPQKIQAKVAAQLNNLAPFEAVIPLLNNLEGKAALELSVSGTVASPKISGTFSIQDATANIPSLGLSLKNMHFQANTLLDDTIHLDARATSGEGTLVVNGTLENLGKENWRWDSNIFGANIRAIENPLLSATINPNLRLQATAKNIALSGSTEIPWARASMKTLPASATRLSKDVVLVNSDTALASRSYAQNLGKKLNTQSTFSNIPFTSNVIVYFGDEVRFKGFGLDSQLIGKVTVLKEFNRQVFTTGFVGVGKGNYKAYGQELKIERGRLIFQGPYDNPGLDIRALRELENVSAGLEIGGTLQRPKSTVFSVPASTPSEAMALLVTGKPLAQSSQADAYALLGAISNLGMDQEEGMSTDIARMFSLDELSIKADKGLDQSSLLVGKYVTPKLFIRYVVGLFDQAFSVGMRYQLSEKFRLEAESGKTQSIDVIYKIER